MHQQQIQPPAPETSVQIDNTECYIPPLQESPSQQLHPAFDAARLEESGILNTHHSHDQEENQQGIYRPASDEYSGQHGQHGQHGRSDQSSPKGRGRGRGQGRQQMPIQQILRQPAGDYPMGSNQSTSNDSQRHKQLILLRTKPATANWPQNSFPMLTKARLIYMDI